MKCFFSLRKNNTIEIFIAALSDQNHFCVPYLPRRIVLEIWLDKADRRSSQMSKDINVFWTNIAEQNWAVQDFSILPDETAEKAKYWCPFQRGILNAHLPGLKMTGRFQVFLADSTQSFTAEYRGTYKYVGRGCHRDALVGDCKIWSFQHLCLELVNDQLPEELSLCFKISTRADEEQKRDAENLKTWNEVASLRSQFPRLLHFCNFKLIAWKERSVLIVEACGDGSSVGTEMKRIADDGTRISTREVFVLVMRFMIWAFSLQRQHVIEKKGFLQDMHMNNCVFMHGVPAGQNEADFTGRAEKFTLFRCVDSNGWWPIGYYPWKDVDKLLGCIYDTIDEKDWRACRCLEQAHYDAVKNVP